MTFRVKFHHAVQEVRALERDMDAWIATQPYDVAHHREPNGDEVYTAMLRDNPDPLWSVRAGVCLYGFRSALDHLALEIAEKHTGSPLPQAIAEKSEFPVFGERAPTPAELQARIGGVHADARSAIEALQPWHKGPAYERDPLWMLNQLCNIDKHRSLNIVVVSSAGLSSNVTGGSLAGMEFSEGPLSHGAQVLRIRPTPNTPGQMRMEFRFSYVVSFGEGPPAFGQPVVATLVAIEKRIANDVFSPLAKFLR